MHDHALWWMLYASIIHSCYNRPNPNIPPAEVTCHHHSSLTHSTSAEIDARGPSAVTGLKTASQLPTHPCEPAYNT